jgi:hypothetical protein
MNRKDELAASVFAGASIKIWYDSTVVGVSINFERFPLIRTLVSSHHSERGFFRIIWIAYVRLERASSGLRRLVEVKLAQHHGPLSNQLGSPGEPEAKNISFYSELGNVFVEV